jgi:hypothetical protein
LNFPLLVRKDTNRLLIRTDQPLIKNIRGQVRKKFVEVAFTQKLLSELEKERFGGLCSLNNLITRGRNSQKKKQGNTSRFQSQGTNEERGFHTEPPRLSDEETNTPSLFIYR